MPISKRARINKREIHLHPSISCIPTARDVYVSVERFAVSMTNFLHRAMQNASSPSSNEALYSYILHPSNNSIRLIHPSGPQLSRSQVKNYRSQNGGVGSAAPISHFGANSNFALGCTCEITSSQLSVTTDRNDSQVNNCDCNKK